MKKKNYTWYLWGMLLSTFAIISLLYWLPDNLFGVPLQKVDIFSELRQPDADAPNGKDVEQLTRNSATANGETEKEIKERDAIYEDLKKQDATLENEEPIDPSSLREPNDSQSLFRRLQSLSPWATQHVCSTSETEDRWCPSSDCIPRRLLYRSRHIYPRPTQVFAESLWRRGCRMDALL